MVAPPTPRTWVNNVFVDQDILNAEIRDEFKFLLNRPRCKAYAATATTPASATSTVVTLDAESWDVDNWSGLAMHDNTTDNTRIVAQTSGLYTVKAQASFTPNATGYRFVEVRKNAAGSSGSGTGVLLGRQMSANGSKNNIVQAVDEVYLAEGDYLELFAEQSSGAGLALATGATQTFLSLLWAAQS